MTYMCERECARPVCWHPPIWLILGWWFIAGVAFGGILCNWIH